MLNVARLKVLKEVAYRGSLSSAAEALSYTQSAISQQIAALEAETGMTLLERHPRGVSLTAAGQTLVGHAEGILARLDTAEAALSAIAGLRGGRLRMASFPTAGSTLMPVAIARFRASYPGVELTLSEGEPEQIVAAPARRRARPRARVRVRRGLAAAGGDDAHAAARRSDVPGAAARAPPRRQSEAAPVRAARGGVGADLEREPLCARHVVRSCHAAGFEPTVSFESDDYQTVQGLVAAGVGVALIPELALSVVREDIAIRALSPAPPVRQVIAATPEGARLVPAAPAMLSVLGRAADELTQTGRLAE